MDPRLKQAIDTISEKAREYDTALSLIPNFEAELESALRELAEADRDCKEHFVRFPRAEGDSTPYMGRKDVEQDWSRCHSRREQAVHRLTKIAITKYPAQPAPEVAAPAA